MSATTHEKLKITSPIGVTAEFVRGELVFFYKACSPVCASVPTRYNDKIIGLSLVGTVTKTENETVRLELDIDKGAPHGSHPYAWAPAEALSGDGFAGSGIVSASRGGGANAKGKVHAVERTGGQEEIPRQNPILSKGDAAEFGRDSDTYKILLDLERRWNDVRELPKDERDALRNGYENLAENAKRLAREDTPYMYGQKAVMDALHENAKTAAGYQDYLLHDRAKMIQYAMGEGSYITKSVSYLIGKTYGDWNFKEQEKWQVGGIDEDYEYFDGNKLGEYNNRNWREWIYFDGEVWGADQIGNMNMAYVGMKMELSKDVFNNIVTRQHFPAIWRRDERDIDAIEKGIELAESER